jgi:hypothetical protein
MIVSRFVFLMGLCCIFVLPFYIQNLNWILNSSSATGTAVFEGRAYTGQIGHSYTVIMFVADGDTVMFNSNDNFIFEPGTVLPVRYNNLMHKDARIADLSGLWARAFIYSLMPLLIIIIIAVHRELIPYHSKIRIALRLLITVIPKQDNSGAVMYEMKTDK